MRYIIGIDLGTTNTCVAYVDTHQPGMPIHHFAIPQFVDGGRMDALKCLPSCCYLSAENEWPAGSLNLPWRTETHEIIGAMAKEQGAKVPTRLVQSAKSWLCHPAAARRDKILPPEAGDGMPRITPVEASACYLKHIKEAWDHTIAKGDIESEFEQQDIVLTVPASFDEIARTLTLEAAKQAGYKNMTLLEEPQAAFYCWISHHEKAELVKGDVILVCDVGGGTTDFSLIEALDSEKFQRMAVGNHLLLGGDNMDAAVAHLIESKLGHQELSPFQWLQVKHQARVAKEALLGNKENYRATIQAGGSNIIQNTWTAELHHSEVRKLLLEGFWRVQPWDEAINLKRGSGFKTLGLPYEEEPSIIKHLAHFLKTSARQPDYVLFNGGALKPSIFQETIMAALKLWFPDKNPRVLTSSNLDLAVSRGAAYYGKARRGFGVRIGGGSARAYYLGVADPAGEKALTLLPRGAEEGISYELDESFKLLPNTPVAFKLYSSHVRLSDRLGEIVAVDEKEMQLLPPIHTVLRFGKGTSGADPIPVQAGIALSAIGTLELWLKSKVSNHRWQLEFELRKEALDTARKDETFDSAFLLGAKEIIKTCFSSENSLKVMELLEVHIAKKRLEWPVSLLRSLWEELLMQAPQRKRSQTFEARWWNLAGFLLRPGFGFPLDDFRLKDLWKTILADGKADRAEEITIQKWICYRRVAGGLNKGQQMQLAVDLVAKLPSKIKSNSELYQYEEKLRTLGAMELIDLPLKIKLGKGILARMKSGEACAADYWALGRIGARSLAYGSIAHVVPREICTAWIDELLQTPNLDQEALPFLLGQLARKTGMREINLPNAVLDKIIRVYDSGINADRLRSLLFEAGRLTTEETDRMFGERLPLGLSIEY